MGAVIGCGTDDSHEVELVVLVDESGAPVGHADKSTVHTAETPLHLAFSCYLANDAGEVLVTRRALSKKTWPGVWTNSFCGHPRPDEAVSDAVHRRAQHELGLGIRSLQLVLPGFRYRATDATGIVENEICPVFIAVAEGDVIPRPDEVAQAHWVRPDDLAAAVRSTPFVFSPWLVAQLGQFTLGSQVRDLCASKDQVT